MNKTVVGIIVLAVLVIGGGVYATMGTTQESVVTKTAPPEVITNAQPDTTMMKKDELTTPTAMTKTDTMTKAGSYESYAPEKVALASGTHSVVLFFRAGWCPTCRAVDGDIKANLSKIPESLTILDVNYDNSTELKQKYGVTYQHTFVHVAADGTLIKKWTASPTLAALVAEVK
jgi:thiol-disulfide isomerase/thioredoxin